MTTNQCFINLYKYFERIINDIEVESQLLRNHLIRGHINSIEYFQKMAELEIRKETIDEVSKIVLQYFKTDSTY